MKITIDKGFIQAPNGQAVPISTLTFINSALDGPGGKDGLSVADFRARARVDRTLDKIPDDATEIELDEKDTATLKTAVENSRWNSRPPMLAKLISELFGDEDETPAVENTLKPV